MITIYGKCPAKKNRYRVGRGKVYKDDVVVSYERNFLAQCGDYRNRLISSPFELVVDVYFETIRPDLDNAVSTVLDCLQSSSVITDDKNMIKLSARKFKDKIYPRVEFEIKELNYE